MNNTTEIKLDNSIANAIIACAKQQAQQDSKTKDIVEKAILAYCEIDSYEAMKQANELFNTVYVENALAKGVPEATAKNRAKSSTTYIRSQAKRLGWKQPHNPNGKVKSIAGAPIIKREHIDGEDTVKVQHALDNNMMKIMLEKVFTHIPRAVFYSIFDKAGNIRQAIKHKAGEEGEVLDKEIQDLLDKEIQALLDKVKAAK